MHKEQQRRGNIRNVQKKHEALRAQQASKYLQSALSHELNTFQGYSLQSFQQLQHHIDNVLRVSDSARSQDRTVTKYEDGSEVTSYRERVLKVFNEQIEDEQGQPLSAYG